MTITERARALLGQLGLGRLSPSVYDIAWLGRLRARDGQSAIFPEVGPWLRARQRVDGSWGADVEFRTCRILTTLSVLLALGDDRGDDERIRRGVAYVRRAWHEWHLDHHEAFAFEVLAPALLRECCRRGMPLQAELDEAAPMASLKLARFPPSLLYDPSQSLCFSLEFVGDALDRDAARRLVLPDGSISNSISATAFYAHRTGDEQSLAFLQRFVASERLEHAGFCWPLEIFERLWVLYHLHHGRVLGEVAADAAPHLAHVRRTWTPRGIGWTGTTPMEDLDSSVIALTLLDGDLENARGILDVYDAGTHYQTYALESTPSLSTNVHALEWLTASRHPDRSSLIERQRRFVLGRRHREGFWTDKWHTSALYATGHALLALAPHEREPLGPTLGWLAATQRDDGGWGEYGTSTVEETAYGLLGLLACARQGAPVGRDVLGRSSRYLTAHLDDPPDSFPALWHGKDLYCPPNIVVGAQLGALAACAAAGVSP